MAVISVQNPNFSNPILILERLSFDRLAFCIRSLDFGTLEPLGKSSKDVPVQKVPRLGPQHRRISPVAVGSLFLNQVVQMPDGVAELFPVVVEADVGAAVIRLQG